MGSSLDLAPGTPTWLVGTSPNEQFATWKMAIEIVDLPMKHGDFPVRYVNVYQRVNLEIFKGFKLRHPEMIIWQQWCMHFRCFYPDF